MRIILHIKSPYCTINYLLKQGFTFVRNAVFGVVDRYKIVKNISIWRNDVKNTKKWHVKSIKKQKKTSGFISMSSEFCYTNFPFQATVYVVD